MHYQELLSELLNSFSSSDKERKIYTILGASGTGKSRLLKSLYDSLNVAHVARLHIRPGRQIEFNSHIDRQIRHLNPRMVPTTIPEIVDRLQKILSEGAVDNLNMLFNGINVENTIRYLLDEISIYDEAILDRHKSALLEWYNFGQQGPAPSSDERATEIFGRLLKSTLDYEIEIRTKYDPPGNRIVDYYIKKGHSTFSLQDLSDGEAQIFLFLPLFMYSRSKNLVLLIDEPELHLNELKAISIWDKLERHLIDASFVYATHSVAFGTRSNVDAAYIIGEQDQVKILKKGDVLPQGAVQNIVGARIQVLKSENAPLFCEDEMHELLLKELFKDDDIYVVPLGNHEAVSLAVGGQKSWENLRSSDRRFCGVIDRDMRTELDVANLANKKIICLPYNETESIFLDGALCKWMMSTYERDNFHFTDELHVKYLIKCAEMQIAPSLKRLEAYLVDRNQCKINFDVSDPVSSSKIVIPPNLKTEFDMRAQAMLDAIANENIDEILKYFKGKSLYGAFANIIKRNHAVTLTPSPEDKFRELKRIPGFSSALLATKSMKYFRQAVLSNLGFQS